MKILAVSFNYATHQEEASKLLGQEFSTTSELTIFHKGDSILRPRMPFFLPEWSKRIDYEAEIVVRISRVGKYIAERFAHRYYHEVSIGLDMTARDLQEQAIRSGQPWTTSKAFDNSAIIGEWISIEKLNYPQSPIAMRLDCDGKTVQQALSSEMKYSIDCIISYISQQHTLKIGDIIFTGTPAGAGQCHIGQHFTGYLGEYELLNVDIK